jgi:hypothetical protein
MLTAVRRKERKERNGRARETPRDIHQVYQHKLLFQKFPPTHHCLWEMRQRRGERQERSEGEGG